MDGDVSRWLETDGAAFLKGIGVTPGHTVLDFGCGSGHYAIPASLAVGENGRVYAMDKNRDVFDALKAAAEKYHPAAIEFLVGRTRIPLGPEMVDVVLCYDVIHYEKKDQRNILYSEVRRVLKRGGLFSVYPKHHKDDSPREELARVGLDEISDEIESSGFRLESKTVKCLLHDDYMNNGYLLNFRRHEHPVSE